MNPETKFRLKAFWSYLFIEPITSKYSIFNLKFTCWFLIFLSLLFKNKIISTILIIIGLILYLVSEYMDKGKYIAWYRKRKYPYKEAIKKVREERRLQEIKTTEELEKE